MMTSWAYYIIGTANGIFLYWVFTQSLGGCHFPLPGSQ